MNNIKKYILTQLESKEITQEEAAIFLKELQQNKGERADGVAVIGMSCRLPMADNTDEFWDNIVNGRNCFVSKPPEKILCEKAIKNPYYAELLELSPYDEEEGQNLEKYIGAFINDIDKFDASFFGISPREAKYIDPGQRVFMETAWGALEDAGYSVNNIRDTNTGVYVGKDYSNSIYYKLLTEPDPMKLTGNWEGILASRISYLYNLRGPAMVIDTACSSGLVSVHAACNAIKNGECDMAIAGGISIGAGGSDSEAEQETKDTDGGALSAVSSEDNKVRTFDKKSTGSVFGEGIVVFVLKSLKNAIKDKDHIYGVIKGSAINNDGASNGLTAPNPAAQSDVIISAWKNAKVSPESVSYIETHGTGTLLGDPIEILGLNKAFEKYTNKKQFCGIGSVKTNIGHLVAASGCASLLKVLLSMNHHTLAPSIYFEEPNPHINFVDSPVYIVDKKSQWKDEEHPLRAGVSAFGFSGTNCHVIVEEFKEPVTVSRTKENQVVTFSAKTETSLKALLKKYQQFFQSRSEIDLQNLSFTTTECRGHYEYRIAMIVDDYSKLTDNIQYLCQKGIQSDEEKLIFFSKHSIVSDKRQHKADGEISESGFREITTQVNEIVEEMMSHSLKNDVPMLTKLCSLYVKGASLEWSRLFANTNARKISLPSYAFDKTVYWGDEKVTRIQADIEDSGKKFHPLVEKCLVKTINQSVYLIKFSLDKHWMIQEHKILGSNIVPGTTYIEVCKEACRRHFQNDNVMFHDIHFLTPLVVRNDEPFVETHIIITDEENGASFTVVSKKMDEEDNEVWEKHAEGRIGIHDGIVEKEISFGDYEKIEEKEDFSFHLTEKESDDGVYLGPRWRCVNQMFKYKEGDRDILVAEVKIAEQFKDDLKEYQYHPSMADAALNLPVQAFTGFELYLPFYYSDMKIYKKLPGHFYSKLVKKEGSLGADILTFEVTLSDLDGNVIATIGEYATKKVNQFNNYVANKYYHVTWEVDEKQPSSEQLIIPEGNIMIFGQNSYVSELEKYIDNGKNKLYYVTAGDSYERIDANHYVVNTEEDYVKFIQQTGQTSFSAVYHMSTIDLERKTIELEEYDKLMGDGVYSLLFLTKALQKEIKGHTDLVLVSSYGHSVKESDPINPLNGAFLSLAKTLIQECTNHSYRCLDIDASTPANQLVKEMLSADGRFRSAFRNNVRYVEQLSGVELSKTEETKFTVKQDGVYLITGGTGGLGAEAALYLDNARHICLLGRKQVPDRSEWKDILEKNENRKLCTLIKNLMNLEENGVDVLIRYAEADCYEQMKELVEELKDRYGKINGILHCAGVAGDGFLYTKTVDKFNEVIYPKIYGTAVLSQLTKEENLDCFILYSSMQTVFGGAGQGDYTVANTFLDGYSQYLRNQGIKAKSINWPAWSETGMAADYQVADSVTLFQAVTNSQGILALNSILNHNISNVIPSDLNYAFLAQIGEENMPVNLSVKIKKNLERYKKRNASDGKADIRKFNPEELLILGNADDYTETQKQLAYIYAEVLNLSEIDIYESFNSMGGDSIIATEVLKVLNQIYGDCLSISDMFSYSTIEEMAAYIDSKREDACTEVEDTNQYEKMMDKFEKGEIDVEDMIDFFDEENE
ncbi:beta-ketoacyl synthase N-terminal-like domain-containing protein [Anaeromicropila populeti]|nr:beta-ketoacyl synthase N-terminal-like domain-containing protein [Anaeromicropila populeti]